MFTPPEADLAACPTLAYARRWSREKLMEMERALAPLAEGCPDVEQVIASGSLGRLEAMDHSDGDIIVLVKEEAMHDPGRAAAAMQAVWQALGPLDLPLPKGSGIYATPNSAAQICDRGTLGLVADDKAVFGKRMQLLLDSTPVHGKERYPVLLRALLERYAAGFLARDPRKEWVALLNDLLRYFRSYCVWHQFDLSSDPIDSWFVRNAKLRTSRLLMFAALILLLGECSKERRDKIGWLHERLPMTPLQRLQYVFEANGDAGFPVILEAYERFMTAFRDPDVRRALIEARAPDLDHLLDSWPPEYRRIHEDSGVLLKELTRFLLDRRGDWSEAFFEYLLF